MTYDRAAAKHKMDSILARLDELTVGDAFWLVSWMAGAEPDVFERAMAARAAASARSGPGKGTTYDDDKGNELQVPG